jgi:hypothetical protein
VVLPDRRILIAGGTNAFGDITVGGVPAPITPNYDIGVSAGVIEPLTAQSFYLHADPVFPHLLNAWQVQLIPYPDGLLQDPRGIHPTGHLNWVVAALLPATGEVIMAGGDDMRTLGSGATDSTQRFDPLTSRWALTGYLGEARALHTLTPLPGGVVLAFGGAEGAGVLVASETYELYRP